MKRVSWIVALLAAMALGELPCNTAHADGPGYGNDRRPSLGYGGYYAGGYRGYGSNIAFYAPNVAFYAPNIALYHGYGGFGGFATGCYCPPYVPYGAGYGRYQPNWQFRRHGHGGGYYYGY
jgi:hypothetical protein